MLRFVVALITLVLGLAPAAAARSTPTPDAAPSAHHRHVTILPYCENPWGIDLSGALHVWITEVENGQTVCAGYASKSPR